MGSDCVVPVVQVGNIREHPQADLLSIVEVLGYQIVTSLVEDPNGALERQFKKDERDDRGRRIPCDATGCTHGTETCEVVTYRFRYAEGDLGVYFPADTVISDLWAEEFDVKNYLRGKNKDRVGRQRLRGEASFGLLVGVPDGAAWEIGQNVAEHYGAKKYEPPARSDQGDFAPWDTDIDPFFQKYTDIQNGKIYYDKFDDGEHVVATEKIHGANSRMGIINGQIVAGSRTGRRADPIDMVELKHNLFWSPLCVPGLPGENPEVPSSPAIQALLLRMARNGAKVAILFGEIYGQGVQSLHYGQNKAKGYRAFDLLVDGEYLDYRDFRNICESFGVPTAPPLYEGPFDLEKVQAAADGRSTLPGADNIREGVVVRPLNERRDPALGRLVLKFLGTEYELSKHKKKDTTDV